MEERLTPAQLIGIVCIEQRTDWHGGKKHPAEEYLQRYPALRDAPNAVLELVYSEIDLRRHLGETLRLEDYQERFPELSAGLSQLFEIESALPSEVPNTTDEQTPERNGQAAGHGVVPPPGEASAAAQPLVEGHEILEEVGRGGMGDVYKARHHELGRIVAVKILRGANLAGEEARWRFTAEARAMAKLKHPNIVQVHEVGIAGDGPYFTMEFLPNSLDKRLGKNPQPPRQAAAWVETLARAMQHAHQEGIIHRDLKPANVLLTDDGTLKITDFGLAKIVEGEQGQTRDGVLGTPSYMAPEQARGENKDVGPAADVYGLGAILYEMLTGRPPFMGETIGATLKQVKSEEPPVSPRQLQLKVPRDLETIYLKCLEKEPARRYGSAEELAADLDRWLAGMPILARPPGWSERVYKWSIRRPAAAALIGVGVVATLLLTVGWAVYTVRLDAALEREKEARLETEKAQERAEAARRRTREALDAGSEAINTLLTKQQKLLPEHKAFLQKMLAFYQEFAEQTDATPEVRAEVANAHFRMGNIRERFGEYAEAETAYKRSRDLYDQLAADLPKVPEHRRDLARSHNNLGILLQATGRPKEAEVAYLHALAIQRQLITDYTAVPQYRQDLARTHNNLGVLLRATGRVREAQTAYRDVVAIRKQLADNFRNVPEYRQELARSYNNLGNLLSRTGGLQEAEEAYHDSVTIFRQLATDFPTMPEYHQEWARGLSNLGSLLEDTGRPKEAEAIYREARAIQKLLTASFPIMPEYRRELAVTHSNLGVLLATIGRLQDAEMACRDALAIRKQLAGDFPNVAEYHHELAVSHHNLGNLLRGTNRRQEAEAAYRDALAIFEELVADFPTVPEYQRGLARGHYNLGLLLERTGRPEGAEAAYRHALAIQKQLTDDFPTLPEYRRDLADSHNHLGHVLETTGRPREAEAAYHDALAIFKELVAQSPKVSDYQQGLAGTMVNLANLMRDRRQFAQARELLERAQPHHEAALKAKPTNPAYRQSFRTNRFTLVSTLAGLGDHGAAAKTAAQLSQLGWDPATDSYDAACAMALCIPVVQNDANLPEARRKELTESYADRALELLRQAVAKGYKDFTHMKKDSDLAPLQQREDFQKLLAELETATKPSAKR